MPPRAKSTEPLCSSVEAHGCEEISPPGPQSLPLSPYHNCGDLLGASPLSKSIEAGSTPVPLDLSTQSSASRKRKAESSRSPTPVPASSPSLAESGGVAFPPFPLLPTMSPITSFNGLPLPLHLPFFGGNGYPTWTPGAHLAASTASPILDERAKLANESLRGSLHAMAVDTDAAQEAILHMGSGSDEDWESLMEISNTDEAEKIRLALFRNYY